MSTIEDRVEIVNEIINLGEHNPLINTYYMALIFVELSAEIMVFERVGVNLIGTKMQVMIDGDHPLKAALLAVANENGHTVQQSIEAMISEQI